MKIKKILSRKFYKSGYEVREELIDGKDYGSDDMIMKSAYNPHGNYIGDSKNAHRLCVKKGIAPQVASESHNVCSIGYSHKDGKWYGWSHRAIYGFKLGYVVKKGHCCASSGWTNEYLKEHPEEDTSLPIGFEVKSLEDAKKCAIAFAASVS